MNLNFFVLKVICAICLFIGIFIAVRGHRFFHWSQAIFAFMASSSVGYILIEQFLELTYTDSVLSAGALGLLGNVMRSSGSF